MKINLYFVSIFEKNRMEYCAHVINEYIFSVRISIIYHLFIYNNKMIKSQTEKQFRNKDWSNFNSRIKNKFFK